MSKLKKTFNINTKIRDEEENQLKSALKEDNKTILRLSSTISNVWGKYKEMNADMDDIKKGIKSREDTMHTVYNMFFKQRETLTEQ